jgi:hypothetical protein
MKIIEAFFLICNGTPLYVRSEDSIEETQALLSGFLSAFQTFAANLDKSQINKIELDTRTYYYSIHDNLLSVLEAQTSSEVESRIYQITASRLGRSFIEKYQYDKIMEWCGDLNEFNDFDAEYRQIVDETTGILKKSQKDLITQYFVQAASDENILGAVVFDLEKDEILASDIPKEFQVDDFEAFGSMLFSFVGRLAKALRAGDINELILRARKYWIGGFKKQNHAVFMIFKQDYFGTILPDFVKESLD